MMDRKLCKYCGKICKNLNSLRQHEIRCKANPAHIQCYGNKGNMPEHTKAFYVKPIKAANGDVLDITGKQLTDYRKQHCKCEICGKTIEESVKWSSKYQAKNLCIDHDHRTKKFRGLLCQACNRQLGWYEKNKESVDSYLNKLN